MRRYYSALALILLLAACREAKQAPINKAKPTAPEPVPDPPAPKAPEIHYRAISDKDSIRHISKYFSTGQMEVIEDLNRIDARHIVRLDTVVVPDTPDLDVKDYSPFPKSLPFLKAVHKIVFFSYPAQYFAAYSYGELERSGPTNMGRQNAQTPTGLYYTNWKSKKAISTVNDEWILKWNFNVINHGGVGWHEYSLPGYPASHSCLRLHERDALYLYTWADQWILQSSTKIKVRGTPVVIFGKYPFGHRRPWRQLLDDPHALDIKPEMLQQLVQDHMDEIMSNQQKREEMTNVQ